METKLNPTLSFGKITCLLLFFSICFAPNQFAQERQIRFDFIGVEDGLPEGQVLDIMQDSRGLMWFGTMKGPVLYDGYEFQLLRPDSTNPQFFSFPTVTCLF